MWLTIRPQICTTLSSLVCTSPPIYTSFLFFTATTLYSIILYVDKSRVDDIIFSYIVIVFLFHFFYFEHPSFILPLHTGEAVVLF